MTETSDQPYSTNGSRHSKANGANGGAVGHFWSRLKSLFGGNGEASLRESLEDVIEQHEASRDDFTPEERSMLLNLLEFGELRVDDVMVPRADIVAVDEQCTLAELLAIFASAGHSRLPVYQRDLDDPIGMVHVKDLVRWMVKSGSGGGRGRVEDAEPEANEPETATPEIDTGLGQIDLGTTLKAASLVRDVLFVPPSMPAVDLLVKMQASHIHMAIVIDEYGGTDGLVSIEDLVEEIVGEIADEHDTDDQPLIRPIADGGFIADARAEIEELERLTGVDFMPEERDEYADTLGGLVFSLVGRV